MPPKSAIIPAEFYQGYLDLVTDEDDFLTAMEKNTRQMKKLLKKIPTKKRDHAYAEGKWTIREMLQHIIDAERVFAYRALRYSRMDPTPLPGFDENSWAVHAGGAARGWEELVQEFKAVRTATEYLFAAMSEEQLVFNGEANGRPQNAFTVGWIISGHAAHHMKILKERYL